MSSCLSITQLALQVQYWKERDTEIHFSNSKEKHKGFIKQHTSVDFSLLITSQIMMHITVSSCASKATTNWHRKIKNRFMSEEFSRKNEAEAERSAQEKIRNRRRSEIQKCFWSQCLPGKEMWATFRWVNNDCHGKRIPKDLYGALNVEYKSVGKMASGVRKLKGETGRIFP